VGIGRVSQNERASGTKKKDFAVEGETGTMSEEKEKDIKKKERTRKGEKLGRERGKKRRSFAPRKFREKTSVIKESVD